MPPDDATKQKEIFETSCQCRVNSVCFAEALEPTTGRHLGNFPQVLSHIGLIIAASHFATQTNGHSRRPYHSESARSDRPDSVADQLFRLGICSRDGMA